MKKLLIILIIILVLLALGAGWIYLLLNGTPENLPENPFVTSGNLEPTDFSEQVELLDNDISESVPIAVELAQVTSFPVAGAVIVEEGAGKKTRVMERGTGHVYDIDLQNGLVEKISNTTLPRAVEAVWSPQGNRAVVTIEVSGTLDSRLLVTMQKSDTGEFATEIEDFVFPESINTISFSEIGDTVFFLENREGEQLVRSYDTKTGSIHNEYSALVGDSILLLDETDRLLYTKPSAISIGYLYQIGSDGVIEKLEEGAGLTAFIPNRSTLVSTVRDGGVFRSEIRARAGGQSTFLDIPLYPEKCAGMKSGIFFWCGVDTRVGSIQYPDAWYQGIIAHNDSLLRIDSETGETEFMLDIFSEHGEQIDITDLALSSDGRHVVFKNKIDNTLWLYNPPGINTTSFEDESVEETE